MTEYGTWSAYTGVGALILAAVLLIIAGVLAYLGTRLHRPVGVTRPGRAVGVLLVVMWLLSVADVSVAAGAYYLALVQQIGPYTTPANPISSVTTLCSVIAFIAILLMTLPHGWKIALGSAMAGTIAAPMIFELPFDLIVAARTYPPQPAAVYTLLFFLPLFLWELASFSLLTLSPLTRLSRYTLFSLAAMFFVFAVWALFGFPYPSYPVPIALNVVSKILCFVVAITLFVPPPPLSPEVGPSAENTNPAWPQASPR